MRTSLSRTKGQIVLMVTVFVLQLLEKMSDCVHMFVLEVQTCIYVHAHVVIVCVLV